MMTLVMSHFNFLASKYFVRPAASLLEKLSIFINFDMLTSLLPTLSIFFLFLCWGGVVSDFFYKESKSTHFFFGGGGAGGEGVMWN